MIQLDRSQMAAFEAEALRSFIRRATDYVRRAYPEVVWDMPPAEVEGMIRRFIDEARSFGLGLETTVGRYIAYRCELGARLDGDPAWAWIGETLRSPSKSERQKVDAVDRRLYGGPVLPKVPR